MKPSSQRVSILCGEPLAQENRVIITGLLADVKSVYRGSIKTWLWTGYKFEDVKSLEAMKYIDCLIDGEYIDSLRDISLKWSGSSNQRVIDVQKTLGKEDVILYKANK